MKNIPRFQGDINKHISDGASTIQIRDGITVRDMGIENAVKYSLFVTDWFANHFAVDSEQVLKSRFETECSKSLTLHQLLNIESAASEALKWMVDNGSVSKIEVKASITGTNTLYVIINIYPPEGDLLSYGVSRNAGNWIMQVLAPAEG